MMLTGIACGIFPWLRCQNVLNGPVLSSGKETEGSRCLRLIVPF